jgi:hypothetical protein
LPGRGLLTVACLVLLALVCLATLRRLEREWRLLARLHQAPGEGAALAEFAPLDLICLRSLATAGVINIADGRCQLSEANFRGYRTRRLRVLLAGGIAAAALAVLIARSLLHI